MDLSVFWEYMCHVSCFGYIITFQLGYNLDKVYQVGIAKSL